MGRGNTPYGSEAPSFPLSPHSPRCGSPRPSTTSLDHPSSTASASKRLAFHLPAETVHFYTINYTNYRLLYLYPVAKGSDDHLFTPIIYHLHGPTEGVTISTLMPVVATARDL